MTSIVKDCSYVVSDLSCVGDGLLPTEHTLLNVEKEKDAVVRVRHWWRDRFT